MSEISQADQLLLEGIQAGDTEAWTQLVDRYRGRLLAFARSRVRSRADAEDLLQDAFLCFLRGLENFRGEASVETYLFTILRRRIIDFYRGRKVSACLLEDIAAGRNEEDCEPLAQIPAADPSASWYARREEKTDAQRQALGTAIRTLVEELQDKLNFRDLKIVEMLFYSQLPHKTVAEHSGVDEKQIALIKHRTLKKIQAHVGREMRLASLDARDAEGQIHDAILTEVWEQLRPSCPKRNTVGAYLLGTLEQEWAEYLEFHIRTLGCRFCQANLEDLEKKTADDTPAVRNRILDSTIGFIRQSYGR
ncbi:MAG: RNA polymerase sigma factor [Phycisphaerae bacterium]